MLKFKSQPRITFITIAMPNMLMPLMKIVKNKKAPAAVVLNACPPPHRGKETAIVSEAREALDVYGLPVSPVSISQRAAFSHALIDGRSVTEFDSTGKAAGEIRSLFTWLETECDLK